MQLDDLKLEDRPRTPRRIGLRFSLLSLLALIFAACFAAAWYGAVVRHRAALKRVAILETVVKARDAEMAAQERTIELLQAEAGKLTITDRSKVHVLELPTYQQRRWKWRVYLPPGKWTLLASTGPIPQHGYENVSFTSSTLVASDLTVEAWTELDEEGQARLAVRTRSGTARHSISAQDFEKLKTHASSWSSIGRTQQVRNPQQPVELLRLRTHDFVIDPDGSRTTRSSDKPTFGILIWIEPDGERRR